MGGSIGRVAVIGAGTMGSAIAAHVANAGVPALLLDLDGRAADAVARMPADRRSPFVDADAARLVTPGSVEADFDRLAECDWIIEAVVEDAAVKRSLLRRVDAVRRPGSVVSSNTSTITLATLIAGMPDSFAADFLITHFFNPPRRMRLLEVVAGERTRKDAVERLRAFADVALGKTVVMAKDSPGFIANRIGIMWIQTAVNRAVSQGLDVEEADYVLGPAAGFPKTGIFGLLDLVGLEVAAAIAAALGCALPADEPLQAELGRAAVVTRLLTHGYRGFYRRAGDRREAIDLAECAYRPLRRPRLDCLNADGLRNLLAHPDRGGRYAWSVMAPTLSYAAALMPQLADDVAAIDAALRLGYNWRLGPFEMIDRIGPAWLAGELRRHGMAVPPLLDGMGDRRFYPIAEPARAAGAAILGEARRRAPPLAANSAASLWDIGDRVACLELHARRDTITADTLALLGQSIALVPTNGFKAMVITGGGDNFAVGADIGMALFAANIGLWDDVEAMVGAGQQAFAALRAAPFPVVGAPSGLALGGGCEMLLHCAAIQAHMETYVGLVETGLGLVPAWGGCKEMLRRWAIRPDLPKGPMPAVAKAFEIIGRGTVAKSAAEARSLGFLARSDGITMNRDRVLADAKARALSMVDGYAPPPAAALRLPGPSGATALTLAVRSARLRGDIGDHDALVASHLAEVLSGGDSDPAEGIGEAQLLCLERRAFMALIRHPATLSRIEHMLETPKRL